VAFVSPIPLIRPGTNASKSPVVLLFEGDPNSIGGVNMGVNIVICMCVPTKNVFFSLINSQRLLSLFYVYVVVFLLTVLVPFGVPIYPFQVIITSLKANGP